MPNLNILGSVPVRQSSFGKNQKKNRSVLFIVSRPLCEGSLFDCLFVRWFSKIVCNLSETSSPNGTHNLKSDSDANLNDSPPEVDPLGSNLRLVCP